MISVTTEDGITHHLESAEAIAAIDSANTQAALQAAYAAGNWENYEPPQAEPEPLPPDWSGFRLALMQSKSFRAWSEAIPDTWREDLKISATVANLEALQTVYNLIKGYYPPPVEAVAEWAELAQGYSIEIVW